VLAPTETVELEFEVVELMIESAYCTLTLNWDEELEIAVNAPAERQLIHARRAKVDHAPLLEDLRVPVGCCVRACETITAGIRVPPIVTVS
jgi:hypothetical protein